LKIPQFKLDHWLNTYHFADNPPTFDFAASTGPHWTLGELLSFVNSGERESLLETELVYSAAAGSERLRQAIADMVGVAPEYVRVVTGASEALLIVFCVAAETGANVLLPFPLFPSTAVGPQLFKLETRFYHLRRENGFAVDIDEIRGLVDNKTKALLVNSPHNPTGATVTNDTMRELYDFALDHGIQFISDEVYHPIYHGDETSSAASLPQATVIGSFSKSLSLSGIRTGWIIDRNVERLRQYTDARSYFTISNPPLAEKFAQIAIRNRDKVFAHTREVAGSNLQLLDEFFSQYADKLSWVRPRGGLTAFPWLNDGSDARTFCEKLVQRGVLLVPGDCFDVPNHFRFGFGVTSKGFGEGLARMGEVLKPTDLTASAA
jgi:aspartate/methionine/tyrosine aminotransferase